MMKAKEFWNK